MQKKGDLLNQLALISDLIENVNADVKSNTLVFEVTKVEFEKIYDYIEKKYNRKSEKVKNTFTITIGKLDIVFNMSNV
jgi:hypothetical protein